MVSKLEELRAKFDKQKEEAMAEKGYKPFYKMVKGENKITFDDPEPEIRTIKGKEAIVWNVNGDKDLAINMSNPIASQITDALLKGAKELTIIRTGEGEDTRYELKE